MAEELLSVREVARRCHRSEETVRRWIWSGKLRAQKLGNQLYVESAALEGLGTTNVRGQSDEEKDRAQLQRLFDRYGYSPILESLRESRGQILPSKEEVLKYIEEDEALQDEMFEKYGPIDAVELVKQVREE